MSSSRYVPVNGLALRNRLLELGISDRELARRTGLGHSMVRSILLQNRLSTSTNVAEINRCLEEVGLSYGVFFDVDHNSEPDDSLAGDTETLAGLLNGDRRMHPVETLALALNWTLERVLDAASNMDAHLRSVGLRAHHNTNGLCIRSVELPEGAAIDRLNELRDDKRGLDHSAARVLFAAYAGTLSSRDLSTDTRLKVGSLVNRGAIVLGTGDGPRVQLSEDCAFAFAVE